MPKEYGSPIGRGKAINTGRTKPRPSDPAKVKSYVEHMIAADQAFHASQRPTGSSGGLSDTLAKGKPPVGIGGRAREKTIMDAVDKAAK
jgi:hypothetical protein